MSQKIKLLCMDVDGTLTDGKIYMGESGELMKVFDIKDGYGIHEILPKYEIIPVIITGRKSKFVENRARELEITEIYQGYHNKLPILDKLMEKYECNPQQVAYIGDDILDICCMEKCGVRACPSDAVAEVKKISNYICKNKGGNGAVRELIDWIVK